MEVKTPFIEPTNSEVEHASELSAKDATPDRGGDGIRLHVGHHREDIQDTVRRLSHKMKTPPTLDMHHIPRLCRYLISTSRDRNTLSSHDHTNVLFAYRDTSFARMSVSKIVLLLDRVQSTHSVQLKSASVG